MVHVSYIHIVGVGYEVCPFPVGYSFLCWVSFNTLNALSVTHLLV